MIFCPQTKKHCHEDRRKAVDQLVGLKKRLGYAGEVYFCPHCGYWHVGRKHIKHKKKHWKEKNV